MNLKNQFLYPEWQIPMQDVILEIDPEKLPGKIQNAEAKIFQRLTQIKHSTDVNHELHALDHGVSLIGAIRRERLGG